MCIRDSTFTIDDLREIARTCDEHGMKSYLTVNTIIYDKDIPLMYTIVDADKEAGMSAVIAADVAAVSYTHLDVYKRQSVVWGKPRIMCCWQIILILR